MGAYFVVSYDIDDPEGYESYVPGVVPLLQKHGADILIAAYEAKASGVHVVLRFDSEEAAMNWQRHSFLLRNNLHDLRCGQGYKSGRGSRG